MPASTEAQESKTRLAKITIYQFAFPGLDPVIIHKFAAALGYLILKKRPTYSPWMFYPSIDDIQILTDLFIDNHPVIQSSGLSVAQALGLLTIFELDNEDYVTAEEAFWLFQNADAIKAKIDRPRNASNAGRASGESRRMANLERNQDICQAATQLLNQGKYARDIVGILMRRFPELKSRKSFGDILKNNCPAWPRYKKRNPN